MSSSNPKTDYMLLFRGADWDRGLSPEELERVMNRVTKWFEGLKEKGLVKGGQPLGKGGRTVSRGTVADGPFAEAKEAIGGFLFLQADNLEAAVAIAKASPMLQHGITIEVRPVLEECPTFQRVRERLALATS